MEFYRKSRFCDMEFDTSPQNISKKDLINYLGLVTNCNTRKLKDFSWKKLFGLFNSFNMRDAKIAYEQFVIK
jgi:hypothetical protein